MSMALCLALATQTGYVVAPAKASGTAISIQGPSRITCLRQAAWKIKLHQAVRVPITVTVNGIKIDSGITDKRGQYWFKWKPTILGLVTLAASTIKSDYFKPLKSAPYKVKISKCKLKVSETELAWPISIDWNEVVSITAKVTPGLGHLNKGRQVELQWMDYSHNWWIVDDTSTTDSNGKVKLDFYTSSDLSPSGDACDVSNYPTHNGQRYTYRVKVVETKLVAESVSKAHTIKFMCESPP